MIYDTYSIGGVLCHHGRMGQKWGVRNGPPYPLKDSNYFGQTHNSYNKEKKARSIERRDISNAKRNLRAKRKELRIERLKTKKLNNFANLKRDLDKMKNSGDAIDEIKVKNMKDRYTNKQTRISNKMDRLETKAAKDEIKYHKKQAKIEKQVANYIKKNGRESIVELTSPRVKRIESKVSKTIYKIEKERLKQKKKMDKYFT